MSDQLPHESGRPANASSLLLKLSNVLILAVLVAIAGLLYSLNRKLETLGQTAPAALPAAPPPLAAPVAAAPAAPAQAARASSRPAVTRNYTRPTRETVEVIAPHEHTFGPVAAVQQAPPPPAPVPAIEPPAPSPSPQTPVARRAALPAGSILTVRMIHSLSSETSRPGDRFAASLDEPVYAGGSMAVPAGATVEGRVVRAERAGRVSGVSELSVQLDRLQLPGGESVALATDTVSRQGETSRGTDMAKVGVGAAIGAAIGAVSGGRKGAGIGAATGAGAAGAEVLLTRGKPAVLTPETRLSFSLAAPVEFDVTGYSQATSFAAPDNQVAPVWPAPRYGDDPFGEQRPRLRRRMM